MILCVFKLYILHIVIKFLFQIPTVSLTIIDTKLVLLTTDLNIF